MEVSLALPSTKNKTFDAIDSFIESISTTNIKMPNLVSSVSREIVEIRNELPKEIITCDVASFDKNYCDSIKIISEILERSNKEKIIAKQFINKCKKFKKIVLLLMVSGILSAIVSVLVRNVIDTYLFCYMIWILCCISLWITLNLLIKDWTQNKYGQKK